MLDKKLINRKLAYISQYVNELKDLNKKPYNIFQDESFHFAAEKLIEIMVGMAIDINFHIIRELKSIPPKDYTQSFVDLGNVKILPIDFARRISGSAGLRNLLVHNYEDVNIKKLYDNLASGIKDYEKYCYYIEKFIEKQR